MPFFAHHIGPYWRAWITFLAPLVLLPLPVVSATSVSPAFCMLVWLYDMKMCVWFIRLCFGHIGTEEYIRCLHLFLSLSLAITLPMVTFLERAIIKK